MALSSLAALHFTRPAWLAALVPLWALAAWWARRGRTDGGWAAVLDPALLALLRLAPGARSASPWPLIALAWTVAVVALAGPAFERAQAAALRAPDDWVLVLDLSPSMDATDLAPSRVARARYAIDDLLSAARDDRVALVVFAGEAHVVTPLTIDVANVRALLQPLAPNLMPESGHALAPAIEAASGLLASGASRRGAVVLFSDGGEDWAAALGAAQALRRAGGRLYVVGAGTEVGAPEPDGAGGFVRDRGGASELTRLDTERLRGLAAAGGGDYVPLAGVAALVRTLRAAGAGGRGGPEAGGELPVEAWRNAGYWLLLPLLLVVALVARRGWL